MNNITFTPQLPCLTYALARIGYQWPVYTLEDLMANRNFEMRPVDFQNKNTPFSEADIIVWLHKAKDRKSVINVDECSSIEYTSHFASFHCAVVERVSPNPAQSWTDPWITHLCLGGGTTYSITAELLSEKLERSAARNERVTPGLVFRWNAYKTSTKPTDVVLAYSILPT